MAAAKRYTAEQIVAKLREAEKLQGQGTAEPGVQAVFIEKASPQQNCYVERFNGSMRDELLNGEHLHSLPEARVVVTEWIEKYNHRRLHRGGLGVKTPAAFAKTAAKRLDETQVGAGGESSYQHKNWTSPLPTPAALPSR